MAEYVKSEFKRLTGKEAVKVWPISLVVWQVKAEDGNVYNLIIE